MTPRDTAGYSGLYLKTALEHLQALKNLLSSISTVNNEEIFRHVHSLKGSSQVMGHEDIAELCTRIINQITPKEEIMEKNNVSIKNISQLVDELENHLQKLSDKTGEVIS